MKPFDNHLIRSLPEVDMPFHGIRAWLMQGASNQLVFFEIDAGAVVPEHAHGAQWGIVVEGEMELTINGKERYYKKGDSYFIPDGVLHSAVFNQKTRVIDFFADKSRYEAK